MLIPKFLKFKTEPLADELAFEYRIFGLDKPEAIDAALQGTIPLLTLLEGRVFTNTRFVYLVIFSSLVCGVWKIP